MKKSSGTGGPEDLGFGTPDQAESAAKQHTKIQENCKDLDPNSFGMQAKAEVEAFLGDVDDIFFGGAEEVTTKDGKKVLRAKPLADDNFIEGLKADRRKGEKPEAALARHIATIKAMDPGNMFKANGQIFYKTALGELQEVSAYIYRLEKTLIDQQKEVNKLDLEVTKETSVNLVKTAALKKLSEMSAFGHFKMFLKKLFGGIKL